MKIKFIADVHISPTTVIELQTSGYQINRVTESLSANATDLEIINLALRKGAVIITQDLDFYAFIVPVISTIKSIFHSFNYYRR